MKFPSPLGFLQSNFKRFTVLTKRWFRLLALGMAAFLATISLVLFNGSSSLATQKVILTYGPQQLAIPMNDLVNFAQTGRASRVLRFISAVSGQNTADFRNVLTQQVPANVKLLDKSLNFIVGELFLYEIGQVLHTSSRLGNIEALRSSLVLSASDDKKVSLLEVIQKYPTPELYIDARKLNKAYDQVQFLVDGAEKSIFFVKDALGDLIC